MKTFAFASTLSFSLLLAACGDTDAPSGSVEETPTDAANLPTQLIPFEAYELANGLDVVLHVDDSDPVVAINLAVHVGSGREEIGRTGFAHLFEHLLFLDSENLGYGGLDEMNTRIGGEGTNGFTTTDMTQYFQAVPADALEKVIWAEADKIGYFIQTVSQDVVDNEKQVVKNEKRQRVDNVPYGHNLYVIGKAIYPEGHPYHHQVIGSLADLDAASLEDVRNFYAQWYRPDNVTLTISGDFDTADAKRWVEQYFGSIPAGPEPTPEPVVIGNSLPLDVDLVHEDNFAAVPQLTLAWPTVPADDPDAPALDILAEYLTSGKSAPLNAALVDDSKLAPSVSMFHYTKELAGELYLIVPANEGGDLDAVLPVIDATMDGFYETGIPEDALARIKAGLEVAVYDEVQSALGKSIALGESNTLYGDPAAFQTNVDRLRAVTSEDVLRVFDTYIANQPRVSTSFVPKGATDLALEGASVADVTEEVVVEGEGAPVDFDPAARVIETPTPSTFDRTLEPGFGGSYALPAPDVVQSRYDNGLSALVLPSNEVPVVQFALRLDAGRVRNAVDMPGVAGMTAAMLEKGTANRTTAELEDAIRDLGSEIDISARDRDVVVSGKTLARNLDATMALVKEMVFSPRWDAEEFDTLKRQAIEAVTQAGGEPNAIARDRLAQLRYPESHPLHHSGPTGYGSRDGLDAITLDDLKAFYADNYTLAGASLRVVGDVTPTEIRDIWDDGSLPNGTERERVTVERMPVEAATIYFQDVPGAKQSVIRMFRPSLSATDEDFALAEAVNFPLGGIYTSKLNTELRVNKGYTYGIRSGFRGEADGGFFDLSTSVRTNVTKESLELIREILGSYGESFTEDELAVMKDARIRGQALGTETLDDKLLLLGDIDTFGYPVDYRARNAERVSAMTLADMQRIAAERIDPDAMAYLVVGDAASQLDRVREIGLPVVVLE